jgi:excisionase family DNA binding protein
MTVRAADVPGVELVTADAVAYVLHVSRSTVYRAAQDGRLPAVRVRGRYLFDPAAVAAAVTGSCA